MSDTMSGEQMQAKIQAARRDAEGLKDRIKRKKDELADTSRMIFLSLSLFLSLFHPFPPSFSLYPRFWLVLRRDAKIWSFPCPGK